MKRRALIFAAAAAPLLICHRLVTAQDKKQPILIGVLNFSSRLLGGPFLLAFQEELSARGWKDGAQITIEVLHAEGDYNRLPTLAQALAAKNPAVILAVTSRVVEAVAKAAPRTPIVMIGVGDPIAYGFAKSLARPGGMVTGVSNLAPDMGSKFVELLVAAAPRVRRIGVLIDTSTAAASLMNDSIQRSVAHHSVEAVIAEVKGRREDIEPALQRLAKQRVQALASMASPMLWFNHMEILRFATAQRWPVISSGAGWVRDGALLS